MLAALPELLDLSQLVRQSRTLQGYLGLGGMSRLRDSLCADPGTAYVELRFRRDEDGRSLVEGVVRAEVELLCQRCLEPLTWPIEARVRLGVVRPGQPEGELPDGYEPLELPDAPMPLAELVEDELLLALPIVPRHAACPHNVYLDGAPAEETAAPSPFQVLAQLKNRTDK